MTESGPPLRPSRAFTRKRTLFAALYAGLIVLFLAGMAGFYRPGLGFSSTIHFGQRFEHRVIPELKEVPRFMVPKDGYDGQFYAQLAAKPAPWSKEIKRAVDHVAYRSVRILPSLVAYAVALGQPAWAMHVYAVQNVVVWLVLAVLLLYWFPPGTAWDLVCWAGLLFSAGAVMAVTRALPDIWALALLAAGLRLWESGRKGAGAALLGISGLARETSILAAAAVFEFPTDKHKALRSLKHVAFVALPALALMAALRPLGGTNSMSNNFGAPFVAMFERFALIAKEGVISSAGVLVTMLALVAQAGYFVFRPRPSDARWRLGIVHVVLMAALGEAVWRGYPGAAPRALLPMLFAFNLSVPRAPSFWPLLIIGNLSVVTGIQKLTHPPKPAVSAASPPVSAAPVCKSDRTGTRCGAELLVETS